MWNLLKSIFNCEEGLDYNGKLKYKDDSETLEIEINPIFE